MLTTIKGYYEQGAIILTEPVPVTDKTEVIVTFLTEKKFSRDAGLRKPGGLKGKVSLPDDFNGPVHNLREFM